MNPETILPAVRSIARLTRVLERACEEISLPQYRVLVMIESGDERATHLAGHLALTKPTITAAVDGLVERGLVAREQVAGDRRAVRLVITPDGCKVLRTAEKSMVAWLAPLFERLEDPGKAVDAFAALQSALDAMLAEKLDWASRAPAEAAP